MTATTESAPKSTWRPNAMDRCDRCNGESRAYTKAEKDGLQLFLCAHHTREFDEILMSLGWDLDVRIDVLDEEVKKYSQSLPDDQ